MPHPAMDFARKIKDILQHVTPLPPEAKSPILHYRRSIRDLLEALTFFESPLGPIAIPDPATRPHFACLYGMALVQMIEAFERFLKESAAVCVDYLAPFVLDDRFNAFYVQGSTLASHFGAGTLGKALCESSTWLDCEQINDRFRKLLSDPFMATGSPFYLFPRPGHSPDHERWRFEVMTLVWQIRHTMVHNVGIVTRSDAVKLRIMAKEAILSDQVISPTSDDLDFLKLFLDDSAEVCNQRVGSRLAELLTIVDAAAPGLFSPADVANQITEHFQLALTVAGVSGVLPP